MAGGKQARLRWLGLLLLLSVTTLQASNAAVFTDLPPPPPFNASENATDGGSFAEILDRVLDKEFPDQDPNEATEGSNFNSSVVDQQAVLETVARVTHDKPHIVNGTNNETQSEQPMGDGAQEVPILIDSKDNMFVMMNARAGNMVLQQDLRFISDLVVVIVSAAVGGIILGCMGQPVITGYLLAGSVIGPGGLDLVRELVQVETLAQFGVIFLLFALGIEFSVSKISAVRMVAIMGGIMQILLFLCLAGITAKLCGGRAGEGVFVGALLSMSSTAIVLKCLVDRGSLHLLYAQVIVGTLILQDCTVGLLFALLPVLGGTTSLTQGAEAIIAAISMLLVFLTCAALLAHFFVPIMLKMLNTLSVPTNELYQLVVVAFCLTVAWVSDRLGLSTELGAFVAGVMISSTDMAEHTLHQMDAIRNIFASLFLASIGMIMNPVFLWRHLDILLASVVMVIAAKTLVVTLVVRLFGYGMRTSLTVGISLSQIGEFAFVLLSRASNLHLVRRKVYLLLLGTTAMSLVTTPLLFRLVPHILRAGTVLGWFRGESEAPIELKSMEGKSDVENEDDEEAPEPQDSWWNIIDLESVRQWYHNRMLKLFHKASS